MTPVGESPSVVRFVRASGRCALALPDLVAALAPVGWPRSVERSALTVGMAEVRGAARTARTHRARLALLGHHDESCSADPIPTGSVVTSQAAAIRVRRIAVLSSLADASAEVDRALDTLAPGRFVTGRSVAGMRRPSRRGAATLASALAVAVVAAPVRAPVAAGSRLARLLVDHAPPLPAVQVTPHIRANLLTELVADALPGLLGSAPARLVVSGLRRPLVVGVRVGRAGTTVSVARDAIRVRNGVRRRVHVVLDDGVEPVLRRAAGRLEREMADLENHG